MAAAVAGRPETQKKAIATAPGKHQAESLLGAKALHFCFFLVVPRSHCLPPGAKGRKAWATTKTGEKTRSTGGFACEHFLIGLAKPNLICCSTLSGTQKMRFVESLGALQKGTWKGEKVPD